MQFAFAAPSDEGKQSDVTAICREATEEEKTNNLMRIFVHLATFQCVFSPSGLRPRQREALA